MIGPGAIIAQRFCRVAAHKNGTGMTDLLRHRLGISHRQLQVLRRNDIRHLDCLVQVTHRDQCALPVQCCADDPGTRHLRQQPVDTVGDPVKEAGIRTDQDGLGILVMLRLGKQIEVESLPPRRPGRLLTFWSPRAG